MVSNRSRRKAQRTTLRGHKKRSVTRSSPRNDWKLASVVGIVDRQEATSNDKCSASGRSLCPEGKIAVCGVFGTLGVARPAMSRLPIGGVNESKALKVRRQANEGKGLVNGKTGEVESSQRCLSGLATSRAPAQRTITFNDQIEANLGDRKGKQARTSRAVYFLGWDELMEKVFTKTCASSLLRGSNTTSASDTMSPVPKGFSVFVTSRARK